MHGLILLDKPKGCSSNAVLQQVKHLFHVKKAGHTGSLDPLATGVLPLCIGEATKFSQYLLDSDKTYQVTAKFGIQTTTGDAEGDILKQMNTAIKIEKIVEAVQHFTGESKQVPPMYSALKHQGKPLYLLARKGQSIPRAPRRILIHQLKLLHFSFPELILKVTCSKGTYIRVLIEDIAAYLGSCAHVTALRRTQVGQYDVSQSYTIEVLAQYAKIGSQQCMRPIDSALSLFPKYAVNQMEYDLLRQGQRIQQTQTMSHHFVRLYYDHYFFGLGRCDENEKQVIPKRLINMEHQIST
ncbi:MAG: tRNA pseudouridine(55) synthase TruB [Endozoicomonadaceae bacterium]|nr:tRNA pseudouridine(55) synthase TruB [Endozoicomonadaceae bacterium]MBE8232636.1 tRNA pseudouridine(55) synthase TruB [Endozoicomonadaceae bacterium]